MSYSTAIGYTPDRRPLELARFRNAHGWSPRIWDQLLGARGVTGYMFSPTGGRALDQLWADIETLPEWQQAPLVLTFDTGIIPWQAYEWAADQLDEFDRRMPVPAGHANHLPAMAELFRSKPEAPFVGVWGTSVTENPFDPWDEDADAPGSGIPLFDGNRALVYVLERHRRFLPAEISR